VNLGGRILVLCSLIGELSFLLFPGNGQAISL
jgi:hypothetical protein